jgi:hypothetical protein
MTVVGGLLWALGDPKGPSVSGRSLPTLMASTAPGTLESVFDTQTPIEAGRWQAIVVHHTGSVYGTAETLDAQARAAGLQGLGYHLVIGNGNGMDDGEVHVGYRWLRQLAGAHTAGEKGDWFNRNAIGVCVVGNLDRRGATATQFRQLAAVVRQLQSRFKIPAERVHLHRELSNTTSPGRLFDAVAFREQLLTNP